MCARFKFMRRISLKKVVIALIGLSVVSVVVVLSIHEPSRRNVLNLAATVWRDLGMKSFENEACHLPKLDPFDPVVVEANYATSVDCRSSIPDLTFVSSECGRFIKHFGCYVLSVNMSVKQSHYQHIKCCHFRYIYRFQRASNDFDYHFTDWAQLPMNNSSLTLNTNYTFLHVECLDNKQVQIYENYHAWMSTKTIEKIAERRKGRVKLPQQFNVLALGIDSVSHSSFLRLLPKTAKWMVENSRAVVFDGYNKVGDNTFVNLVPILTGKTYEELTYSFGKYLDRIFYYDSFPLIWKDFEQRGYATFYAEDDVNLNTFNVGRNGFRIQPTDLYMRPFWLAFSKSKLKKDSRKFCVGGMPSHRIILSQLQDFVQGCAFVGVPFFSFVFLGEVSHGSVAGAAMLDYDIREFMVKFEVSNAARNTVLFLFSDHGSRWGSQRKTLVGQLEDRLPLMSVVIPQHVQIRYPQLVNNVHDNVHRLTSPFDFHATMQHILQGFREDHPLSTSRSVSFFKVVPKQRSCADAGIETHWCACSKRIKVEKTNEHVVKAASQVILHLNAALKLSNGKCAMVKLEGINDSYIFETNYKVQTFKSASWQGQPEFGKRAQKTFEDYFLIISILPSHGLIEVTVRRHLTSGVFKVISDIGRLDRYGEQAKCTEDNRFKKFCFCNSLRGNGL